MMEINFCKPDSSDIKSLKKLWLSSFDEEPKAVDFLTNVLTQNKLILQSTAKKSFPHFIL